MQKYAADAIRQADGQLEGQNATISGNGPSLCQVLTNTARRLANPKIEDFCWALQEFDV
jgi:homoserine kinase